MTAAIHYPHTPPPYPPPAVPGPPGSSRHAHADRPPRRWLRVVHALALLVAIPVGIGLGFEAAAGILVLFVLVVPFEKLFRRHDYRLRRPGLRTDLTYALASPALNAAGIAIAVGTALIVFPLWLPALALRPLVTAQPGWLMAIETVLLLDILIYWTHRLSHTVGFLWRFHSIHHSSERMDWISGIRQHPVDGVIIGVPVLAMLVAGFQLEVVGAVAVIQTILGLFAHANVRWRLRPLHKVVMTPEFHHWHHANHPESIHTNYSVFLPVWDLLWSTYRMPDDERPEAYGNNDPIPPSVPGQLFYPFRSRTRQRYPFPPVLRARIPFTRARRERVEAKRAERSEASK